MLSRRQAGVAGVNPDVQGVLGSVSELFNYLSTETPS